MSCGSATLIVGGAGFIGSHLTDRLAGSRPLTVFDDLSVGRREHLAGPLASGQVRLVTGDTRSLPALEAAMAGHETVVHLSANPEARWALENPRLDLEQGTLATWNVLEAMRKTGAKRLVFASSGTVYGPRDGVCREADLGELPISLYGASKLAGEAMIAAWVECFGIHASILRFGNVVGSRGTHGVALDFLRKLEVERGARLEVLGDGRQSKPYLHVSDCAEGLAAALDRAPGPLDVFNLAPDGATCVAAIAAACVAASPWPSAPIHFGQEARGWPGDVPRSRMSGDLAARVLGFRIERASDEAVAMAIEELAREVFTEDQFPEHRVDADRVREALAAHAIQSTQPADATEAPCRP